ncbi:hypothetical protein MKW92_053611, partial [Papaver armeniacum]
ETQGMGTRSEELGGKRPTRDGESAVESSLERVCFSLSNHCLLRQLETWRCVLPCIPFHCISHLVHQ